MDNKADFFGDDLTFDRKIDDDFSAANVKTKTIDFLSSETFSPESSDEKTDVDVKEKNVDDFLNFHDDLGDENLPQSNDYLQSNPILMPTVEKKDEQQPKSVTEPTIDFTNVAAMEDEYLNPYGVAKSNEKFISSEDLIAEFKDPIDEAPEKELPPPPKPVERPIEKPVEKPIEKPQPVPTPAPIVEEKKSSATLPQAPKSTQIEAEKIFKSIGLGKYKKKFIR